MYCKRQFSFLPIVLLLVLVSLFITKIESKAQNATTTVEPPGALLELEEAFSKIIEKVKPAVVNISAEKVIHTSIEPFFPDDFYDEFLKKFYEPFFKFKPLEQHLKSLGSGIIINPKGYILTNTHVISGADKIIITLSDKTQFKDVKVVGSDSVSDLSVLKVNATHPLPTAILGDSDKIKVGSWAIAIGNPYGLDYSVTVGIISAKGRTLENFSEEGFSSIENLIQTDASINPGNSGGPLVNIKGEVIGINTAIASPNGGSVGIGFAIPSNTAKIIMAQLIEKGKVSRGWIGIYFQPLTPELADFFGAKEGVLISDVVPNSPAAKAGLQKGDIITKFNGEKITEGKELQKKVKNTPTGEKINLTIIRNKKEIEVTLELGEKPSSEVSATQDEIEKTEIPGIKVAEINSELVEKYHLDNDKGVVITDVEKGSPAALAGLEAGDIILQINNHSINTIEDYNNVTTSLKEGDIVVLLVKRGKSSIFVAFKLK